MPSAALRRRRCPPAGWPARRCRSRRPVQRVEGGRERKVQEQDVRPRIVDERGDIRTRTRLPHNLELRFGLEQSAQAVPKDRTTGGDDDANGLRRGAGHQNSTGLQTRRYHRYRASSSKKRALSGSLSEQGVLTAGARVRQGRRARFLGRESRSPGFTGHGRGSGGGLQLSGATTRSIGWAGSDGLFATTAA